MDKPDSKQEQMDKKQSKENSKKNQNEMLEVKNTVNDFNGLIRRLDTAKAKYLLVWGSINRKLPNCKAKNKKIEKTKMPEQNIQEQWLNYRGFNIHIMEIL